MDSKKQSKILISAGVILLILLVIFGGLYYFNNHVQKEVVTHRVSFKAKTSVADLSIREATGLTIVYAHLKYGDNQNWTNVYEQANNGDLEVDHYPEYSFDNYTITPDAGQALYIVNKEAAIIFTNQDHPSQGAVILSDDTRQLDKVNVSKVYQYVKKHGGLVKAKKISQKMNLEKQMAQNNIRQNSSSSSSAQSSSSNRIVKKNDNNSEIEIASISPALQGTWYAAGLFAEKLNSKAQISSNAINGKTIYKLNKRPNSEKELKAFGEKYHDKFIAAQNKSNIISIVPAESLEVDTENYSLTTLDGVQCLMESSTGIAGVYFKTPDQAAHFTQKYKGNEDKIDKKLMD